MRSPPIAMAGCARSRSSTPGPSTRWVWGAFRLPGSVLHALHRLWQTRQRRDEYIGTLVNAYLAAGGEAVAVGAGTAYVDVGTLDGYREAMRLLTGRRGRAGRPSPARRRPGGVNDQAGTRARSAGRRRRSGRGSTTSISAGSRLRPSIFSATIRPSNGAASRTRCRPI